MRSYPLRPRVVIPILLCASLLGWVSVSRVRAAGSKRRDPNIAIRFHAQVESFDPTFAAKVVAGNPPRQLIVEKIPSISERDIASFYPYRAADGTFSAAFQLDPHGRAVLEALSSQLRGRFLLVMVNTRAVTLLKVDKTITDGVIFIPFGLTLNDIHAIGSSFSLMGHTDDERDAKKEQQYDPITKEPIPNPAQAKP